MQIQAERLYLFETSLTDPYFLGTKDGILATLSADNPRYIDFLSLDKVYFFADSTAKAGLTYSLEYGGEDSDILESYGKSQQSYDLELNMSTKDQRDLEAMVGRQFSVLGMKRDLTFFVVFGQFQVDTLNIDNEIQQRVRLSTQASNARFFTVGSFDIGGIEITLDPCVSENDGGFDYGFDILFD